MDELRNTYAILLNGPPYSGKDTAALALYRMLEAHGEVLWERFSMPLKRSVSSWLGEECDWRGDCKVLEARKEEIIPELGVSYRQAQIELSERHMKRYGYDVFGRLLARRIRNWAGDGRNPHTLRFVVIPDSGFGPEAVPIVECLPSGNVALIQIRREGRTFAGDSRSYVEINGVTMMYAENNGDMLDFQNDVCRIVKKWMNR